jgi:hypothetical protein
MILVLQIILFVFSINIDEAISKTTNFTETRNKLIDVLFGLGSGILPTESEPILVEKIPGPTAQGCYCAYFGECSASSCQYGNNMSKIVWNIQTKVNDTFTLDLNSTVIYTLNTSGTAPVVHDGAGREPQLPGGGWYGNASKESEAIYPQGITDTLVIFHHGHVQPCDLVPDIWRDRSQDWLNQLGYDVMGINMPLHQLNYHKESNCQHSWFQQFEDQGVKTIGRYFLEPVVRTINYAKKLGYKRIIMMGLSGGGWTTTLMGAIDTRIQLSLPVAGSIPCEFNHTSWDYEQYCSNKWAQECDYKCLYALAGLEKDRYSVQIIHEHDPCCFHGYGRHNRIREYNTKIKEQIHGHFETVPTIGNIHEVNVRDKTIAASLIDRLRTTGTLSSADFESIPFNTLKQW